MRTVDEDSREFWRGLPPMQITYAEAKALPEYSASNPTGVQPGKRWRRHNGVHDTHFKKQGGIPRWIIRTYEEVTGNDKIVANNWYRPVIRVKMGRRVI